MRWIVVVAAVEAAATSLILILSPSLFGWLILGAQLSEAGQGTRPAYRNSPARIRIGLLVSGFLATSSLMKSRNSRLRRRWFLREPPRIKLSYLVHSCRHRHPLVLGSRQWGSIGFQEMWIAGDQRVPGGSI